MIGGKLEVEYQSNSSNVVNMDIEDHDGGLHKRHMDVYVHCPKLGKLSLGQGDTASNGTSESDLTGVRLAAIHVGVHDAAAGFIFYNKTSADYVTNTVSVGDIFTSMDGMSRRDRIRYDSPQFVGFNVSGSLTEKEGNDVVIRYKKTIPHYQLKASIAYADPGKGNDYKQMNGSISVLCKCGISLTLSSGRRDYHDTLDRNASFYYGKLAYEVMFGTIGSTSIGVDYGRWNDVSHDVGSEDEASSYGIGLVQNLSHLNTEVYTAFRIYILDRPGFNADFDDIKLFWAGLRFKF